MELKDRKHWFFDLDGTIYLGDLPIPSALEFVNYLFEQGAGCTFLTNNSSKGGHEYLRKLRKMGLVINEDSVFTSGQATSQYLARDHAGARVFLLGTPALAAELGAAGVRLVEESPDMVVVGFDTTLNYARLAKACSFIRNDATYVATHPDVNCPTPDGPIPDAGAFMALIEASTDRRPDVIVGKPNVQFIREAARRANVDITDCIMVGDRLETDMRMAVDAGIPGVLVFTGVTQADDERLHDTSAMKGILTAAGLSQLHEAMLSGG